MHSHCEVQAHSFVSATMRIVQLDLGRYVVGVCVSELSEKTSLLTMNPDENSQIFTHLYPPPATVLLPSVLGLVSS